MPIVALNHYSNVGFLETKFLATSTIDIDFFKGKSFNKKETETCQVPGKYVSLE